MHRLRDEDGHATCRRHRHGHGHAAGLRRRARPGQQLLAGRVGARRDHRFDVADLPAKIACQRSASATAPTATFNPDDWMAPKDQRKVDDFIVYGIAAADQAVEDAGWQPETDEDQHRAPAC